jgi:hypothetical protein
VYYLGFTDWGAFGVSPLPAPVNCNLFTTANAIPENEILIFPNPVASKLTIDNRQWKMSSISIYGSEGKNLLTSSLKNTSFGRQIEIDVQSLLPGIYFLELTDGEKMIRRKFVKQ